MNRLRCVLAVARTEYLRWLTDPRVIIVGVLLVFMRSLAVEPLLERAVKFGERLNILEPFVAVGNSGMLVMLMPCVFLILISDYPKMTGSTLFFIKRTGKTNWLWGQVLFLLMAIATFLLAVLVGSMLVSGGTFAGSWSNTVTKYAARFPNEADSFVSQLLPSNLYNQLSLISAVLHTLALMTMYLFSLSLIIYFFKLIHIQSFGLFAAIFIVAAGVMTCSLKSPSMWAFPMANTIVWLHYDEILSRRNFPVWCSYAYFATAITALLTLNACAARKLQLYNIELVE